MRVPQPLYHATLAMPVGGMPKGWTARVLFLRRANGIVEPYAPLIDYMQTYQSRSSTWQDNVTRGLGLLWDFTRSRGSEILLKPDRDGRSILNAHFRAFAIALSNGTIEDGDDPSGLFWPRTGLNRARVLLSAIEAFTTWLMAEEALKPPPEVECLPQEGRIGFRDMLIWARLSNVSMLKHLAGPTARRVAYVADLGRPFSISSEPVKFFPRKDAERLLWEGHVRSGRETEPNEFFRYNLRDQMMALLDGWGGLRRSEGLHIWVQDVVENPNKPGHALVVLHHPAEGRIETWDPSGRRTIKLSRQEVLASKYGLRPRHLHMRGGYHAGWKGMDLGRHHAEIVYWRDDRAAELFWILYVAYIRFVRPGLMDERKAAGGRDHPFLFVSEGRGGRSSPNANAGAPYSPKAYERNHKAAVKRLGLAHSKDLGTTTHGLRHLYGQTLADWRLSAAVIRKCLHHLSFLSQAAYIAPSTEAVNDALRAATEGRSQPQGVDMDLGGSETTQALYRLSQHINGRMPA